MSDAVDNLFSDEEPAANAQQAVLEALADAQVQRMVGAGQPVHIYDPSADDQDGPDEPVYVANAFLAKGGCYVAGFTKADLAKWQKWAQRVKRQLPDPNRALEIIQLAFCLLDANGKPLFMAAEKPTLDELKRVYERVPQGTWNSLVQISDGLSGFECELLERLRKAGCPTPGGSSDCGASTASEGSPSTSPAASGNSSRRSPTTSS